jgi:hypothetical protein
MKKSYGVVVSTSDCYAKGSGYDPNPE